MRAVILPGFPRVVSASTARWCRRHSVMQLVSAVRLRVGVLSMWCISRLSVVPQYTQLPSRLSMRWRCAFHPLPYLSLRVVLSCVVFSRWVSRWRCWVWCVAQRAPCVASARHSGWLHRLDGLGIPLIVVAVVVLRVCRLLS